MGRDYRALFADRFGCAPDRFTQVPAGAGEIFAAMADHRVCRSFSDRPVADSLVQTVAAAALSAPSKSDLQQRDIVLLDLDTRQRIASRLPHMPWIADAPRCALFCVNGRRLLEVSSWRGKPFANDHFDLLFNAIGDAALCLGWFILAAEAAGLGGCPISEIRNFPDEICEWADLPEKVIPFAAYCFGWPDEPSPLSPRLPLEVTLHERRFDDRRSRELIEAYDRRRARIQPYDAQRDPDRWGTAEPYGWSEEKARQYAVEQRALFGAFVRRRGFSTD